MNQRTETWRKSEIARLEDSARRDELHANTLEADALDIRRRAEMARKAAEYLRKSEYIAAAQVCASMTPGQREEP